MVCQEGDRPALYHGGPLCRTRDREDESSLSASLSSLARQPSPMPGHGAPASREGLTSCTARPADTSGARQALAGPMLPPRFSRTLRVLAVIPASVPVQPEGCDAFRRRSLPLAFSSFFLIAEAPRAARLLRGRGAARLARAASPAAIRRHKKRRPPAWRPADVRSRFMDVACGIRTACRAGKRWPRNRRPARKHCSTGHGSGS